MMCTAGRAGMVCFINVLESPMYVSWCYFHLFTVPSRYTRAINPAKSATALTATIDPLDDEGNFNAIAPLVLPPPEPDPDPDEESEEILEFLCEDNVWNSDEAVLASVVYNNK